MRQIKSTLLEIFVLAAVLIGSLLSSYMGLTYITPILLTTAVFYILLLKRKGTSADRSFDKKCDLIRESGDISILDTQENSSIKPLINLLKDLQNILTNVSSVMNDHSNKNLKSRLNGTYGGFLGRFKKVVNRSASNLEFTIVRISRITDSIQLMIKSLTESSNNLAEGSLSQAASLEEISSTVVGVASETKNIDKKSEDGYKITEVIRNQSQESQVSIQKMLSSMESVKSSSEKISNIIKVIDSIAFQTNLLALNAAVEAARAGRHGKGFAVVADEVRNLANRSAKAAKETESLIEDSLQSITNQATMTEEVSNSFQLISENIEKMSEVMNVVNISTTTQTVAMSEISEALSSVDSVVQGNTAIAEDSSSMAEHLSTDIDSLKRLLSGFELYGVDVDESEFSNGKNIHVTITDDESILRKGNLPAFPLQWNESYQIGVDEMDFQHSKLVEFINTLYSALKHNNSAGIVDAIQNLLDYTVYHFSAEEALLHSVSYPDLENHIPMHHKFISLVEQNFTELKESGHIAGFGIVVFLTEWLLKHILQEDKKYSDFINRQILPLNNTMSLQVNIGKIAPDQFRIDSAEKTVLTMNSNQKSVEMS